MAVLLFSLGDRLTVDVMCCLWMSLKEKSGYFDKDEEGRRKKEMDALSVLLGRWEEERPVSCVIPCLPHCLQ